MFISKGGLGGVRYSAAAVATVVLFVGSSRAEDISVNGTAPRTSRVRTAPQQRKAAPTRPRPIQDETTPQAAAPTAYATPQSAPRPAPRRAPEQAVDLGALSSSTPATTGKSAASSSYGAPSSGGGLIPNMKFYYDFMLRSWKGESNKGISDFTFDSYHQRMMVEFMPNPDITFMAEVLTQTYFEMDYQLSKKVQVRWGRIWIPFDDFSPHNMFGGRINTSDFFQFGDTEFLPDIWADLGIGFKFTLADMPGFNSILHLYVVNGFNSNFNSPVEGEPGNVYYPNFAGHGGGDNNNSKAFGARWHVDLANRFGFGASIYHDTYTPKEAPKEENIDMLGLDAQLRPTPTTNIRVGFVTMKAGLISKVGQPDPAKNSFMRGGTYVELGQKFGQDDRWKFLLRTGTVQNDNRVVDVSDKTVVGGSLIRNFGIVEAQVNIWKDVKTVAAKSAYNYGEFRLVTAF